MTSGWQKDYQAIFKVMNDVTGKVFSQFKNGDHAAQPAGKFGETGKGFGWGTVHHAVGSMRMPYRPRYDAPFEFQAVVDEDLRLAGTNHLYICDMSVIPMSTAGNPVRTLAALALRLSRHFG